MRKLTSRYALSVMLVAASVLLTGQSPAPNSIRLSVVKILDTPRPGTGVIVSLSGGVATVLTASHVIQGATGGFRVSLGSSPDDPPLPVRSDDILGMDLDPINGLAAFRVRNVPAAARAARLGDSTALTERVELVYWGYPGGAPRARSYGGAFSGLEGTLLVMDRSVGEGASGGPVVVNDRVVGITTSTDGQTTFAIIADVAVLALRGWGALLNRSSETAAVTGTPATTSPAASRLPGTSFRDCPECPEMVVIPAGAFTMGSPATEADRSSDEGPQHAVTVRAFALGKFEITVEEFQTYVDESRARIAPCSPTTEATPNPLRDWRAPGFSQTATHPVVCVSRGDAVAYLEWLSQKARQTYRLPTEAEWEYAARAGSTTARWWGASADLACNTANVLDASATAANLKPADAVPHNCDDKKAHTAPIGAFSPNPFGLHDMLGNVWEWTADCYHVNYDGAPTNGSAWLQSCTTDRAARDIRRGGSYSSPAKLTRSAYRSTPAPETRLADTGFRAVMTLP